MGSFRGRLTARRVETAPEGRYVDALGLMLWVRPSGARSWVLRVQQDGRRRDIGLGSWPTVTLAMARDKALATRRLIMEGRDPVAERKQAREVPTLAQALDAWIAKEAPTWRGGAEGHTARMTPRLFERNLPTLMQRRVTDIDEKQVLAALAPVWHAKHETAKKLFERLRGTMRLAKAKGWTDRALDWEEVREALPSGRPEIQHHKAMALADLPSFVATLQAKDTAAARALLFAILTAARSGEARGALWDEVDLENAIWTVPAARMKAKRPHEVPLAPAALALLQRASDDGQRLFPNTALCFPSPIGGKALSDVAVSKLLRASGHDGITVHGFRSCFRNWAAERGTAREVAEACLAHAPQGGAVERAYLRTSMLERRRALIAEWAAFCVGDRA